MRAAPLVAAVLVLSAAASSDAQLRARVYASGFTSPVAFVQDPTDRSVQLVVEQGGRIRVVQAGRVLATPFLDLTASISSGGERGLLGLAFSPDYATSGRFFVNFTDLSGNTVVARFRRSANRLVADPTSRFDLRWGGAGGVAYIAQPFANHNGGNLAFGPDGFLYVGMGDGGGADDPNNQAQDPTSLLGKMLRVDVGVADSDAVGYRVPPGNPFVTTGPPGVRPEIWAFGLRNPWRWSFDDPSRGGTGALVIGDVGQSSWEEIDYEPPLAGGRNYGWRYREGAHDHITTLPPAYLPLTDPIFEYDHTVGNAITGGFVYRGARLGSAYRGRYFFADFGTGKVWSLALTVNASTGEATASGLTEHSAELWASAALGTISSFGTDADGELYIVGYTAGKVFRILGPRQDLPDFDGDGRADPAVYRASTGTWFWLRSANGLGQFDYRGWGAANDVPVPADLDGDHVIDPTVFRPSTGTWFVLQSSSGYSSLTAFGWGIAGDIPVPSDYDGDGTMDAAVYRPSTGTWYVRPSSNPAAAWSATFGAALDVPVPGDYDGDGKSDIAVYRPSTGTWFVLTSSSGYASYWYKGWGVNASGDTPAPGDYDGDGKLDPCVFRPTTGTWFILESHASFTTWQQAGWGASGDTAVPSDYDGDGITDIAVYRPSNHTWYVLPSSGAGQWSVVFGEAGDVPLITIR